MKPKKLKRAVIKEELVKLTSDHIKALILNQFIYWSERINDADRLIEEETNRMKNNGQSLNMTKQFGWIYKKAEDIADELMLEVSVQTIRRNVKQLIENGWLHERRNPKYPWDKVLQYRVDFIQVMKDLNKLGYHLDGYEDLRKTLNNTIFQNGISNLEIGNTLLQPGNPNYPIGTAIPEITTETTSNSVDEEDDEYTTIQRRLYGIKDLSRTEAWFVQTILDYRIPITAAEQIMAKVDLAQVDKYVFFKVIDIAIDKLERGKIHHLANWISGALLNEQLLHELRVVSQ